FGRQPLPYPTPRKAVAPSQAELLALAGILGADVPFCVLGGTALGTARGDELISIMSQGPYHWAIATDKRGLSPPEVFAAGPPAGGRAHRQPAGRPRPGDRGADARAGHRRPPPARPAAGQRPAGARD